MSVRRCLLSALAIAAAASLLADPAIAAPSGPFGVIEGTAIDSLTREPVVNALVRLIETDRSRLTDAAGRFSFVQVAPGTYTIEIEHVAYVPRRLRAVMRSPGDKVRLAGILAPRTYVLGEVTAETPPVLPLTSGDRANYRVHPAVIKDFALDGLVDVIKMLPGVTVSGDRPFFRGIGFEQVLPLIDGVPAREPLKGRWILPPPQAVSSAEFISEAFGAETGQSLAGVMSFHLAEGGDSRLTRISYKTDRPGVQRRSDNLELGTSGPTAIGGLYYSASVQGYFTNTNLSYPHGLPDQSILGMIPVGNRMYGNQSASFKLTFRPRKPGWKLTGSVVHSRERRKDYHDHYSRSGWVGFNSGFDRYTTFVTSPAEEDSAVFYDGPSSVPTSETRSALMLVTASRRLGPEGSVEVHAMYGHHSLRDEVEGRGLDNWDSVRQWSRHAITSINHQEEWFYSVHGDIPEFEWSASREGGAGGVASLRIADAHQMKLGMGIAKGRHRYIAVPSYNAVIGSFDDPLDAIDGYVYLEDEWFSDRISSMSLAIRYDFRRLMQMGQSTSGSTWAPSIAFHQPMTEKDAFHTQAGLSYQFPALQVYFVSDPASRRGIRMNAQRMAFFEAGMQHHYSRSVVAYLGAYRREYSNIVFSERSPSALEAAFGVRVLPPQFIETDGIELVVDHQIGSAIIGQASLAWSKTTQNDREAPWSRRAVIRDWLSWRALPTTLVTLTCGWDTGRPYDICIKPRGCMESQMLRGRLPAPLDVNLAVRWGPKPRRVGFQVVAEIRNLLNRRIPTFDFGVGPMRMGSANFLAYYHEHNATGGYIVDLGDRTTESQVHNPETRAPGLNALAGVELQF